MHIKYIFYFVIILLACSCTSQQNDMLNQIDILLSQNDIKQGSFLLDSIYRTSWSSLSTSEKRYYQLLRIKAADKSYQPIINKKAQIDSIIYCFKYHENKDILAESYFYAGRIYYSLGDSPEALHFYQMAEDFVSAKNHSLRTNIYCQKAYIYNLCNLYSDAILYLKKAYAIDFKENDIRNQLFDLRDLGQNYLEQKRFFQSIKYGIFGLQLAQKYQTEEMECEFHHFLATVYTQTKQYTLAEKHLKRCLSFKYDEESKSGIYSTAFDLYKAIKDEPKAEIYAKWLIDSGNIFAKQSISLYRLQKSIKNKHFSDASIYLQQYEVFSDSIKKSMNSEAIKKIEKLYNYNLKEKENEKLKATNAKKNVFIISLFFFLIFSITLPIFIIHNLKQKHRLLTLKKNNYDLLKNRQDTIFETDSIRKRMLLEASSIYKTIMKEINQNTYKLTSEQWEEIENKVNEIYPNFTRNLESFHQTSEHELKVCLLIKMNITPTNISKFLNRSKEAITSTRRRLYQKTFQQTGNSKKWDEFILAL